MPEPQAHHTIGQAAKASGVSPANIRFYEAKNLLVAHSRSESSYRLYSDQDIHGLRFIRLCRSMDMSLEEIQSLMRLELTCQAECAATQILDDHLSHVRERLAELKTLERQLRALRSRCTGAGSDSKEVCQIMDALHGLADEKPTASTRGRAGSSATRHV